VRRWPRTPPRSSAASRGQFAGHEVVEVLGRSRVIVVRIVGRRFVARDVVVVAVRRGVDRFQQRVFLECASHFLLDFQRAQMQQTDRLQQLRRHADLLVHSRLDRGFHGSLPRGVFVCGPSCALRADAGIGERPY